MSLVFPRSLTETTRCLQVTSCTVVSYPRPFSALVLNCWLATSFRFEEKKNIDPTIEIPLKLNAPKVLVLPACRVSPESRATCRLLADLHRELKQGTSVNNGRKPKGNTSHAMTVVYPSFSNNSSPLMTKTHENIYVVRSVKTSFIGKQLTFG